MYETLGKHDVGLKFLLQHKALWEESNLACHCYWHLGLCYLELGKKEEAINLFDSVRTRVM